jgi:hypothetical protein
VIREALNAAIRDPQSFFPLEPLDLMDSCKILPDEIAVQV